MKKIKAKITNVYNRYLSLISKKTSSFFNQFSKNIKTQVNKFNRHLFITSKKTLSFIFHLKFMKNSKVSISVFNRYLILSIVILFSYLFYLSIPTFYNYGDLQKELTKKLQKEFNLNTALSANITYKILPTPNFEISNVLLNTNTGNKFNDYAQIKKMKIYVKVKNLHNQKKLEIKNIIISEANFNINMNSYSYLNNYFKNKVSNKKIKVKNSKIFFKENNSKKNVVALSTINKLNLIFDKENNNNKMNIKGSIYNTNYYFTLSRNIYKKNITNFRIKLKKLNTLINSNFVENINKKNNYNGKIYLNFSGSEINTDYEIIDDQITFKSKDSILNNNSMNFEGEISLSPFHYNVKVDLEQVSAEKVVENLSQLKNLLNEKIFLNKNVNGKIIFNIDSLQKLKFFEEAQIIFTTINGKLTLDNSTLKSNKIGKMVFTDSSLKSIDDKKIFKTNILFEIYDQKKFYQKLQIPKDIRIKLNNIYFELEKDINKDEIIINKFILNKDTTNTSHKKTMDLTNLLDMNEINNLKNWIELKKFSRLILFEAKKIN